MTGSNGCALFTSEVIHIVLCIIAFLVYTNNLTQVYFGNFETYFTGLCFQNEAMTGYVSQTPAYSRITLALLHDTG